MNYLSAIVDVITMSPFKRVLEFMGGGDMPKGKREYVNFHERQRKTQERQEHLGRN
jgi:hypothetical protein